MKKLMTLCAMLAFVAVAFAQAPEAPKPTCTPGEGCCKKMEQKCEQPCEAKPCMKNPCMVNPCCEKCCCKKMMMKKWAKKCHKHKKPCCHKKPACCPKAPDAAPAPAPTPAPEAPAHEAK